MDILSKSIVFKFQMDILSKSIVFKFHIDVINLIVEVRQTLLIWVSGINMGRA